MPCEGKAEQEKERERFPGEGEKGGAGPFLQAERQELGSSAEHSHALRAVSRAFLEAAGAGAQAGNARASA